MLVAKKQKRKTKNKKTRASDPNNLKADNKKAKVKISILLYSLAIVLLCVYLLSRYAHTTQLQMKLSEKEKTVNSLIEKKNLLNLELEEIRDSGAVEAQAKIRMNMRKANKDQIIYVDIK